jgi:hypothetical protein
VCQLDAIVIRDDLNFWITKNLDYIGAPWTRKIHFEPNFKNKPHLTGGKFDLEVGNGGLSLRHVHNTTMIIDRYAGIISEFKAQFNFEDAMFALIGLIDKDYRVATFADAAAFSLEVSAREIIQLTGRYPMGFHNLHTYDKDLWDVVVSRHC